MISSDPEQSEPVEHPASGLQFRSFPAVNDKHLAEEPSLEVFRIPTFAFEIGSDMHAFISFQFATLVSVGVQVASSSDKDGWEGSQAEILTGPGQFIGDMARQVLSASLALARGRGDFYQNSGPFFGYRVVQVERYFLGLFPKQARCLEQSEQERSDKHLFSVRHPFRQQSRDRP